MNSCNFQRKSEIDLIFEQTKKIEILAYSNRNEWEVEDNPDYFDLKYIENNNIKIKEKYLKNRIILNSLKSEKNSQIALQLVENKIDDFIALKLPQSMPMLAMFLNEDLKNKIKSVLLSELGTILPDLLAQLGNNIKDNINIQQIVYKKVADFSSDKFEEILFSIMQKEFKLIEILGGILGFIIGIIQLLLVKFA